VRSAFLQITNKALFTLTLRLNVLRPNTYEIPYDFLHNTSLPYPSQGTLENLRTWSGDIGSDITFFFSTGTAYCTGRGEIVTPLAALPEWEDTTVHVFKPKYVILPQLLLVYHQLFFSLVYFRLLCQ
jgi:hypothetical protein